MTARSRNIVICSDGTGNSYDGASSNVWRVFDIVLKEHPRQIACYDPGIGTLPMPAGRTTIGRALRHARELSVGTGLMNKVAELYRYLMMHYEEGDRLFLFGFSRGAFTVRALAGMLHVSGLLRPDDTHLLAYALGLYETSEHRIRKAQQARNLSPYVQPGIVVDHAALDEEARAFKTRLSRPCEVHFMGIWDTVKAYGWFFPRSFPALRHNPNVRQVRHAVALDEHRSAFQVTGWGERREPVKEVWFAGDHADVGGGHEGGSALADATLMWMLGEATAAGAELLLDAASRGKVEDLRLRANGAPTAATHDLWPSKFWMLDCVPRLELDNRTYPPRRWPRIGRTGTRTPGEHAEGAPLRLHDTVAARARRDSRYEPARLLARLSTSQPGVNTPAFLEEPEHDQAINESAWVVRAG